MSIHLSSIENHAVFGHIKTAKNSVADILAFDNLTVDERNIALRINLILENFEQSVKSNDANLISLSWLAEAQGGITQIGTNLANYNTQQSHVKKARLDAAAKSLDSVLTATAKINLIKSGQSVRGHAKALENHTSVIQSIITDYKNELNTAKKVVAQLNELQEKVSQHTEAKNTEISDALKKSQEKLVLYMNEFDEDIRDLHTKHEESLEKFNEKFEVYRTTNDKKITDLLEETKTHSDKVFNRISDEGNAFEAKFEELLKRGYEVLEIVSHNAFTTDYNKAAENAQKKVTTWNRIAIASMSLVVTFTIVAFGIALNRNIDWNWTNMISATLVTTAGASISIYAARQATKYGLIEKTSRKTALKLAAFTPFVRLLEREVKDEELRTDIAKIIFNEVDEVQKDGKQIIETYKALVDELVKIVPLLQKSNN